MKKKFNIQLTAALVWVAFLSILPMGTQAIYASGTTDGAEFFAMRVSGKVSDSNGDVLPGVTVKVIEVKTEL